MALLSFLGKKKKDLKAACQITKEPIEAGYGYLLTTSQVVTSKKYWDLIMTEPETMSYTVSHFNNQPSGTQMRSMIFDKYAAIAKPWMVCDSVINYFEIDKKEAKENAKKWWESEGSFIPEHTGPASQHLAADSFNLAREYAIMEAGRARVK